VAVLELAGVPVFHDPAYGEGGGYRIRSDWWFPQVGLTDRECLELAVVSQVTESRAIPLLEDVATVRDKLLNTLPAKQADLIRDASELFDIIGLGLSDHGHCREVMVSIQTAMLAGKQVKTVYRSPHEKKVVRPRLQPLRVILAGQAWYLVAQDSRTAETKLYRIARFQKVEVLEREITCDRSLSIREFLGNAWTVKRGERDWHVEIEFAAEIAEVVAETRHHPTQEIEFRKNGSAVMRCCVSGLDEIQWFVLSFGPRAKVRKPRELAEQVRILAQETTQLYATGSGQRKRSTSP
jgi:predicted DNA-binding transcriptional regulator YafY